MSVVREDGQGRRGSDEDALQFRWIYSVCFVLFLAVAFAARLVAWRWRPWPPGPQGYRSIVQEARDSANTIAPFAFMG